MTEAYTARSGAPSLRINGATLHSSYDPEREAQRFVEESLGSESPSTILVLGEGLGYIAAAAARQHPEATILVIIYSAEIFHATNRASQGVWHSGADVDIKAFLRAHLGELEIEGLRVVEWPVSQRLFPEMSRTVNEAVRQVVQEMNGSFVTTVGAGRLWIRNAVANFIALESPLVGRPCAPNRPIVIVAPGPTLERAAHSLVANRDRFDLWALPSSCVFLKETGLVPDLVVMTDPGFYSIHHLQFAPTPCPLAMPLSAARGAWDLPFRPYLLCQPDLVEKAFLHAAGIAAPVIAPHGTVAATALDLALMATEAPVIMAGLDMSMRDITPHARPSAFDTLLQLDACRTSPHASRLFHRASAQHAHRRVSGSEARVSPALRTYAGWFDELPAESTKRLFRLMPSEVPLRGLTPLDADELHALLTPLPAGPTEPHLAPDTRYPGRAERRKIARGLLAEWHSDVREAGISLDAARLVSEKPSALSLHYLISPRLLMEMKGLLRRGDRIGAARTHELMQLGTAQFLADLARRVPDVG